MKKLAIIGASYLQLPLIERAKELGYETHVFAWEANDVGEKKADFFYPISIVEKDKIANKCEEIGICGICSIASDLAAITVCYVAEKLKLPCNSLSSTVKSTNKYLMRNAFELRGDPSPKSIKVDNNTNLIDLNLTYPVIVKPTDRSGSRGICKLTDSRELKKAVHCAISESFEKKALIEEYVEGKEYSVEYISYKGIHHFLALTLKYTTGAPHFIETGHFEPAPVECKTLERIKKIVEHALDTLEIKNSASHTEIKIDKNKRINIIEIGGRMGGDCIGSDLVKYSTGIDFVRAVIQVAVGQEPDLIPICKGMPAKVTFIFNDEDVKKFEELQKKKPDQILQVVNYDPKNVGHTTNSSNRAGCYIIKM